MAYTLGNLDALEAEAMHVIREVAAEFENPVLLYSIGKDSMCMLHVARKAFAPAPLPFPLLHIDTTWNFREMIAFRDRYCTEHRLRLLVHVNEKSLAAGMNPFDFPSNVYTPTMNTHPLIEALTLHRFDAALGGGRRDEEKSRAKERVFSFRDANHQWHPKNQRPELWNLYNARVHRGESIRVFPLSNWTEFDIWQYIHRERIPLVPLYFAADRPVVDRDGQWIMVDDDRFRLRAGETPVVKRVRFRTMGDYPLTAAHESTATTVPEIIAEMLLARTSERQGRLIDKDEAGSMEKKKREGYF
ncbi:MAG: sulfate adenylyltransferase subunit CysD [Planctomycetia bacterium]|jgi:sulfate adenylyltransferase subunit 2